ncbi:MAG: 3-hydroxyacyl-CoA dehydrogenase [Actinobacteria bacterium]|nr:MAG: 3-hydroxyacyl-CoA dehydrogenase [Actinomycetota bacterium]
MSTMELPAGAPEEVVTHALRRDLDLAPFGVPGKLAIITLENGLDYTRPNTFGPQGLTEIGEALDGVKADSNVVGVAITGKPYILAAGADLSAVPFVTNTSQAAAISKLGHDAFRILGEMGKPTFAFINGLALGGGLEIALHSQYRTIAASATIGLPEVFLGLVPGWGGTQLLPRLIGPDKAVQVIVSNALNNNKMLSAPEAFEFGIADLLLAPADFLEKSIEFAADIISGRNKIERADHTKDVAAWNSAIAVGSAVAAKKYIGADIAAPRLALELIALSRTASRDEGFDAEDQAQIELIMSNELRASIYSFNLIQKMGKKVQGAPKSSLARKVTKVGVVGAGLMASQLALLFVRRMKVPVIMTDIDQERVDKGVAYVHAEIAKLVAKGRLSEPAAHRLTGLVTGTVDKSVYATCDFVIEAVFEEMSVKQKLFSELEEIITPECILATNTSSLSVEGMSKHLKHPERVVGFHFFNPVGLMPLLEVARTPHTTDEATATAIAVGKELKKTMVITKDAPAFVVNRLLTRFWGEVTDAADEGTPFEIADTAISPLGLPMTPFTLFGLVGPAVALHVSETLHDTLGPRFTVSENMKSIVAAGVRTFYIKNDAGKIVQNPEAFALMKQGSSPSTADQVRVRALTAIAEEARMMLDEEVVATPQEIDLCMMMGAGWPLHTGGILPYLDESGISEAATGRRFHPKGVASLP